MALYGSESVRFVGFLTSHALKLVAHQLLSFRCILWNLPKEVFMNQLVLMLMTIVVVVFLWNS
jgi:hypothetical protein